jgi:transcriptional regulator with XRE-family HTH domain
MDKIKENAPSGPYQVEREQIIKEIGDLESIRKSLGLSRRKICKLLLVDPSSWTRWTKLEGSDAPAYIYRSLQWCLAIMEKYPESHPMVRSLSYEKENKVDQLYKKIDERLSFNRSMTFELKTDLDEMRLINQKITAANQNLKQLVWGLAGFVTLGLLILLIGQLFRG